MMPPNARIGYRMNTDVWISRKNAMQNDSSDITERRSEPCIQRLKSGVILVIIHIDC